MNISLLILGVGRSNFTGRGSLASVFGKLIYFLCIPKMFYIFFVRVTLNHHSIQNVSLLENTCWFLYKCIFANFRNWSVKIRGGRPAASRKRFTKKVRLTDAPNIISNPDLKNIFAPQVHYDELAGMPLHGSTVSRSLSRPDLWCYLETLFDTCDKRWRSSVRICWGQRQGALVPVERNWGKCFGHGQPVAFPAWHPAKIRYMGSGSVGSGRSKSPGIDRRAPLGPRKHLRCPPCRARLGLVIFYKSPVVLICWGSRK